MWPTEESSIIYITFQGAFFPIVINTVHGAEQTPEVLVRAAESLGANKVEIFLHVVLPAALPSIAAGLAMSVVCVLSIALYLAEVGLDESGGWLVDGDAMMRLVLPFDTIAAVMTVSLLVLAVRRSANRAGEPPVV